MKAILGFTSFVFIAGGVTGLLHQWIHWVPPFFGVLRFVVPDGTEIYSYIVLIVLGIALGAATDAMKEK